MLLRELFSIVTFILILVTSASRMTVGTTSSRSTASLNWICVPAELTVAYGISSPSEIEAVPFSTVTTSGRASVRVLLSRRSASSARLMLYRLLVKPNAIPPAPAGTTPPPSTAAIGRLTRFPPSGRPVVPLTGSVFGKPEAAFGGPNTLAIGTPPCNPRLLALSLVNPRPTRMEFWLAWTAPPPPHCTPMAKRSSRSRISMRASIFTCGRGTSSFSRISVLMRSRSAS